MLGEMSVHNRVLAEIIRKKSLQNHQTQNKIHTHIQRSEKCFHMYANISYPEKVLKAAKI